MKKTIAIILLLCLSIGLCACKEDNTCVNCDNDWKIKHNGDKYCRECYNDIPGVERICVNCGELNDSYHDTCDDCYEKIKQHASDLLNKN